MRQNLELYYEENRINGIIKSEKFSKMFPEKIKSEGLEEQPYIFSGSKGANQLLNSTEDTIIVTGPCILSAKSVKEAMQNAKNRIDKKISNKEYLKIANVLLSAQPSLQNVLNIGAYIDNSTIQKRHIVCIMEVYEIALLLAGNDAELFEENEEELIKSVLEKTKFIQTIIENIRKHKAVKSKIIFFYTNQKEEKKLIDQCLLYIDEIGLKPSVDSYYAPLKFSSSSKARIEVTYTNIFIKKLKEYLKLENCNAFICENYRHFYQILNGSFVMPSHLFEIKWLSLLSIASITSQKEMEKGEPLFLGIDIKTQLEKSNVYSLGSYILSLCHNEELLNKIFKSDTRAFNDEELKNEAIYFLIENIYKML